MVVIEAYHCYKILSNILMSRLTQYADNVVGDYPVDFDVIDQHLSNTCEKLVRQCGGTSAIYRHKESQ
jgi:hypothetical protein